MEKLHHEVSRRARGRRGPQKAPTWDRATIRLDRDVAAHSRAGGRGWQARLNKRLREPVSGER